MRSMTTLCSSSDSSLLLMRTKINSFSSHNTFHSRVFSRQHFVKLNNKLGLRQFQHSRSHFNVLHSDGDNAIKLTRNSENWECSTSEKSYSITKLTPKTSHPFKNLTIDSSWNSYLKFMLFFGIFAFQDAQNALAGSDVASLVQSNSFFGDFSDLSTGFASAFLLIFFSELGDKTFFIAALLAARNSAAVVFMGTFGALGIMTIISVVLGRTFHYVDEVLPFRFGDTDIPIDDIAAALLLVYFGVSTLLDASSGDGLKAEEEQKEAEIAVSEVLGNGAGILAAASTVISTFLLVFVAEWGDKSFFSTIALAAASSPLGVIGGALAGHGLATLLAVLGGSLLGTFLSEKVIAYVGGVLFLVFAAVTLVEIVT
ncbi:GDT1-like protein 1, chloroplastic isoform X1 [Rutidosis leptorrhynchoides]|uniref:GDT1-like protein 1, chloroplastic isoform X1 n=1 Tax=Rutidosis leptorrhynchoides TaxID=125765 RepID=UPI003A99A8C3